MRVTLLRRLAAISYDCMLLFSVLFIATLVILPLISDSAIESGNLAYNIYLLIISYLYFCWQWLHGGQTLGMKSWRIQLVSTNDHAKPGWKHVTLRFLCAIVSWVCLGAGFLSSYLDKNNMTWHDRCSSTRLILRERI